MGSRDAVIRSLAYNAKGKPKIEGAFGNIEQVFFALLQGWTAGDRMRKKTHMKGKAPVPFAGSAVDFLDQFRQRIGAKKILMQPIADPDELAAYVLVPRFENLTKTAATQFHKKSGGNWRSALELADACGRLMDNEKLTKLDARVVTTAAAWMAGHS